MKNLSTTATLVAFAACAASSRSDATLVPNQAETAVLPTNPAIDRQYSGHSTDEAADGANKPKCPTRSTTSKVSCKESFSPLLSSTPCSVDATEHAETPSAGIGQTSGRIPWVVERFPRGGDRGTSNDDDGKPSSSTSPSSNNDDDDDVTKKASKKPNHKNSTKQSPNKGGGTHKDKASAKDKKKAPKRDSTNARKGTEKKTGATAAPNIVVEEVLQHDDFYDVLGVTHTASEREIQKAYRKRCVQTHPDKTGGDRRAFDKVAEAYEVLSDTQKRQLYNRFGKSAPGLGQDGGSAAAAAGSYQDIFRSMFQQAQEQSLRRQQANLRRNRTLRYQLQVTLEDLYCGKTQTVVVTPPYQPHNQQSADDRRRRQQKQVDVHIPRGSMSGQSIIMSGEVDFQNDTTPGDLIFILTQVPHPTFTRKGNDLAMELTIDLEEAICGFQRPVRHLDGTELWIESAKTDATSNSVTAGRGTPNVIQTGDIQVLKGWGMPKRNRNGEFGDLYIQFRVEMPKAKSGTVLTEEERMELSRLLSKLQGTNNLLHHRTIKNRHKAKKSNKSDDDNNQHLKIHTLQEAKTSDFGSASGKVYWEEDGEGMHEEQGDDFHPFASAASSFFQPSGSRGRSSFYFGGNFGGHPFGGGSGGDPDPYGEDDGNVQCQHM